MVGNPEDRFSHNKARFIVEFPGPSIELFHGSLTLSIFYDRCRITHGAKSTPVEYFLAFIICKESSKYRVYFLCCLPSK